MQVTSITPPIALQPFVKTFLVIESETGSTSRVLPGAAIVLAFRYKGRIRCEEETGIVDLPGSVISGLRKSARVMHYGPETGNVLVVFQPGGARAFFHDSLHEWFGQSLSLDLLIPASETEEIEERLALAGDQTERIGLVERFLLDRLTPEKPDMLVREAIARIRSGRGMLDLKELLSSFPLSRDPFEKRFRRVTGTSPKQFSSIVRLNDLIRNYSPRVSLTGMAYDAGYFDQSHFIREFRAFTGKSPRRFFGEKDWW